MSTLSLAVADSATMLRRNVLHMRRYPSLTIMLIGQPLLFLLLFVFVFGETLGDGIAGAGAGRAAYLDYITPAILMMAVCSVALGTAISVAGDMTQGIAARFRTMPVARVSVLTGHVLGALLQTGLELVVVLGVSVALGYRPGTSVAGWLGVAGMLLLISVALTWICVALGLVSDSVETASNLPMPLVLLPFFGSGFVPAESMPGPLRWFAENQPFTPMIESVRHLLQGTPAGNDVLVAIAWCVGLSALCAAWSVRLYRRKVTA